MGLSVVHGIIDKVGCGIMLAVQTGHERIV